MVSVVEHWWWRCRPEHPRKIIALRQSLSELNWESISRRAALSRIFNEIDLLAEFELQYYYRRRSTRSWVSGVTRVGGWVSGAAGLLLPLLAATDQSRKDWIAWGYVALAVSGSCFGANSLFGGTSGHASFVTAQLAIERLIVETRLAWAHALAETLPEPGNADGIDDTKLKEMFDVVQTYAGAIYDITATETEEWRKTVMDEFTKAVAGLKKP